MASLWMTERRPDEKGAYRATLTSVVSKTFVYMSQYKQRNRVLFFRKPVYCFATRWKWWTDSLGPSRSEFKIYSGGAGVGQNDCNNVS